MKISEGSKRRCREKFPIKGIGKTINTAVHLLENEETGVIISEFICDSDDDKLYNVMLFLIRENCKDEKIINELNKYHFSCQK